MRGDGISLEAGRQRENDASAGENSHAITGRIDHRLQPTAIYFIGHREMNVSIRLEAIVGRQFRSTKDTYVVGTGTRSR